MVNRLVNNSISTCLQERINAGDFPSAVYLVAEKGEIVMQDALGHAVVEPERIEARLDTIYDVASLTKVLVTGLLLARLVDGGTIGLEDTLADHLESARGSALAKVSLRSLVNHTSGLPAWKPFYLLVEDPFDISNLISQIQREPKADVVYSDLNFLILSEMICAKFGKDLERLAKEMVFDSLGLIRTGFNPTAKKKEQIAASEKGNAYERQTCADLGYLKPPADAGGSPFRSGVIWGEVHDGNAYFMGGVAGHAGLFSTAEEVFKIAQQFLRNYTQLLKPETCELFRTNSTPGMNEDRSFAFQLASTKDSTAGTNMSPESFGHLGFTGTSLWIDPVKERIFVLLTNRTHNRELPFVNINSVRRQFHDLAIDILDKDS